MIHFHLKLDLYSNLFVYYGEKIMSKIDIRNWDRFQERDERERNRRLKKKKQKQANKKRKMKENVKKRRNEKNVKKYT
tara:strand:- start:617 stop:850 length:234 start_codon:yes stop_codon:yes gene_type:complete